MRYSCGVKRENKQIYYSTCTLQVLELLAVFVVTLAEFTVVAVSTLWSVAPTPATFTVSAALTLSAVLPPTGLSQGALVFITNGAIAELSHVTFQAAEESQTHNEQRKSNIKRICSTSRALCFITESKTCHTDASKRTHGTQHVVLLVHVGFFKRFSGFNGLYLTVTRARKADREGGTACSRGPQVEVLPRPAGMTTFSSTSWATQCPIWVPGLGLDCLSCFWCLWSPRPAVQGHHQGLHLQSSSSHQRGVR